MRAWNRQGDDRARGAVRRGARAAHGALLAALTLGVLLGAGCGDDPAERYSPVGAPTKRDAGPGGDAAIVRELPDAGTHDTEIFSGDVYLCGYDAEDALVLEGDPAHAELAIASDGRGFALVHHDEQGALLIEAVPIEGETHAPVTILGVSEAAASVAIAASEQGFLLAWRSGGAAGASLRTRELSTPDHPVVDLTDALVARGDGELSALFGEPGGFVAAWLELVAGEPELRVQRIAGDGTPRGEAVTIDGVGARNPEDLHLAHLDPDRALLAWLERAGAGPARVMGQTLSAELAVEGEPLELSKHAVAGARFDLAARAGSAGLLYQALDGDVREAIKYRRVDSTGAANAAVLNIVNAPGRVVDGSIAPFGQGYAVAYRALPSLGVAAPAIRVAFINQFGAIVHEAELAETTEEGSRTVIAASEDGHLLVGWSSDWPSGPATHALKLHCPGALILCGGSAN